MSQEEKVEVACRAWWDAKKDGKRIAIISWDEIPEQWKTDYRNRMSQVIDVLEVQ
jgi:hypothetical protein